MIIDFNPKDYIFYRKKRKSISVKFRKFIKNSNSWNTIKSNPIYDLEKFLRRFER